MAPSPYEDLYIYYLKGCIDRPWEIPFSRFVGNWEEEGYTFLFFTDDAGNQVNDLLARRPGLSLLDQFRMTYKEWQGEALGPARIGQFRVLPPWCRDDDEQGLPPGEEEILLDPGVVFGNGLHPTTRDCMKALEMAFGRRRIDTVMDLGTGTGLLALVAGKLGCRRCLALDFNFLAARTAYNNVRLNGMEKRVLVCQGRAEAHIETPSDLLVANIHFDVMRHLVASEGILTKGAFVLSGLLRSEARQIAGMLSCLPVEIVQWWERDNVWHTFYGERRG